MELTTAAPAPLTSTRRASVPPFTAPHPRFRAVLPSATAVPSTGSRRAGKHQASERTQALGQARQVQERRRSLTRACVAMGASTTTSADTGKVCTRGRVLSAPAPDSDWWDRATLSGPVVIPPPAGAAGAGPDPASQEDTGTFLGGSSGKEGTAGANAVPEPAWEGPIPDTMWRMYYCGRDADMWGQGVKALPTAPYGRVGLAVSRDGLHWMRYKGPLPGGAIFDPSPDPAAFDSVHVSASDVLPPLGRGSGEGEGGGEGDGDGLWRMYYFGGGMREGQVPDFVLAGKPEVTITSLPFQIGYATSSDGVTFQRRPEPILTEGAKGEVDEYSVNFPRVLPPRQGAPAGAERGAEGVKEDGGAVDLDGSWCMTYHTRSIEEVQGQARASFTACLALSRDGVSWEKKGGLISGGGPGSWDEEGVGLRHIKKVDGTYYMLYTGVSKANEYAIGLATSPDGLNWTRAEGAGPEPGGPVLRARKGEEAWDSFAVGAPYLVERPNGEIWMYFFGASQRDGRDIAGVGVAVNRSRDCRSWERMDFE